MFSMKKIIVLLILFFGIFFSYCKKDLYDEKINGQWQWMKTVFVRQNNYAITSESVDSTFYIEFGKNGDFYVLGNSKDLLLHFKYKLYGSNCGNCYTILDSPTPDQVFSFSIIGDTLESWQPDDVDAGSSYYLKVK
jgi:hypothetical protein